MTDQELQDHKDKIDGLSRQQMARLQRFAPSGHPYFDMSLPLWKYFEKRFATLGGMSPEISKSLGWGG